MSYDPSRHHRRSIRLRGYDYTQCGAYFVTICTFERQPLLCQIRSGMSYLTAEGQIVAMCWEAIPEHFPGVELDSFVAMPDHVHGVIVIALPSNESISILEQPKGPPRGSLGAIIGQFKAAAGKRVNALRGTTGMRLWHRNYYEHIIRDQADLARIRTYIEDNPKRWHR